MGGPQQRPVGAVQMGLLTWRTSDETLLLAVSNKLFLRLHIGVVGL